MEHMRMDPKHQFAAQYVLSRAAAERRERELLAGSSLGKPMNDFKNPTPRFLRYSRKTHEKINVVSANKSS